MAAFEYRALDDAGQLHKGVLQADTARQVRARLREQGLVPLNVDGVAPEGSGRGAFMTGLGRERALLLRQLSVLINAGLPLEEALAALAEHSDRPALEKRLAAIRSRVMEGQALSGAMAEHRALFPDLYTAAIAAGERAGRLEPVLARLADYAEAREVMGRNLAVALVYPVVLTFIALAVVWGLIGFVVPRVVGVFESAGHELPWMTRSLLAVSGFIETWAPWLLGLLVLGVVVVVVMLRREAVRRRVDGWLLGLPVLGRLVSSQQTARFNRTLAILTASAVPLVEALTVAGRVIGNYRIRADIMRAARRVREGSGLDRALEDAGWLPAMPRRLIASGERSGDLAAMLEHAADVQERQLNAALAMTMAVLQPALILVVGLLVFYIVLAIMLPILNVSQLVS